MALINYYKIIGTAISTALHPLCTDVVAWLELDGERVTTLYRFDSETAEWYWEDDWYEGEKEVSLRSFCPLMNLRPVIHAHWLELNPSMYSECSNCHRKVFATWEWDYCPNCGAVMDEEV